MTSTDLGALAVLAALLLLALTAWRWGADTRASGGWDDPRFTDFPHGADRR
ncbi:hypothetical protein GTQ99_07160 [Kineococcus sp. T13]|uniref:hypothetical protein n=1 Tax=Kineococcus vitellinus TaxID=2696565 RepID=UPI0014123A5A|nr:hypothetical protein [Kineococcus vitellinus]NAZ75201.1 hypothetical protein [Kineococcus vitellinus]